MLDYYIIQYMKEVIKMEINDTILRQLYAFSDEEKQLSKLSLNENYFKDSTNNNLIILRDNLFTSDKSVQLRKHTRFISFPLHSHDYIECSYIISGSVTHILDGNEIVLEEGDMIILNVKSSHEILKCQYNDLAINFIISPSFLKEILTYSSENDKFSNFIIRNYFNKDNNKEYYIFRDINKTLKDVLSLIINHYYNNDSQEKINLLFTYILIDLFTNHIPDIENNTAFCSDYIISRTTLYIEKNYVNGSLFELSEILNVNYSYLSQRIKSEFNYSFKQLIQIKRLEVAMKLIVASDIPIKEIAQLVGYENTSYFYKIFFNFYHETPNFFRKQKLN